MTEKESTSGGATWRRRTIASVGVAAAVAAGCVALASSASADVTSPVKIAITGFNAQTVNDGISGWDPFNGANIRATNVSGAAIPLDSGSYKFQYQTVLTGPAGLTQEMVDNGNSDFENALQGGTIAPQGTTVANPCPSGSFCSLPTAPANGTTFTNGAGTASATSIGATYDTGVVATADSPNFGAEIDTRTPTSAGITGDYTLTVSLNEVSAASGNLVKTLGSTTVKSTLGNPAAPTLATSLPAGTVNQPYSAQLVTSGGFPSAPSAPVASFTPNQPPIPTGSAYTAGYRAYVTNSDGTITQHALNTSYNGDTVPNQINVSGDDYLDLGNNLYLDTVTGKVVADEYTAGTGSTGTNNASNTIVSATVVANNGVGGSTTQKAGNLAVGVLPVEFHDVSTSVTLSIQFSDVAANSTFATAIYSLANAGILQGFGDGTFRPKSLVTRQQFAHFAAAYLNFNAAANSNTIGTGQCTTVDPSAFPDVANSASYCAEIRDLAGAGVINGGTDGKFSPAADITRGQISALLYRVHEVYLGINLSTGSDPVCTSAPFPDVSTSYVFCGDISFGKQHNIMKGFTDGNFHPSLSSTREGAASFIYLLGEYDGLGF